MVRIRLDPPFQICIDIVKERRSVRSSSPASVARQGRIEVRLLLRPPLKNLYTISMPQPYEKVNTSLKVRQIIANNFIGGLFWALGATIGLAIIFSILTVISRNINLVPVVGSFVSKVIDFVLVTNPNFHK